MSKWFEASRWFYNETVAYLRQPGTVANRLSIQKGILSRCPAWALCTPYTIKQMAIDDACQAVMLAKREYAKTGQIQKVSFRRKRDREDSCYIPKTAVTNKGVYAKSGGKLHYTEEVGVVDFDCKLTRKAGRMFLSVPKIVPVKQPENQRASMVAIDPGVRTFASFWSPEMSGKIGAGDFGKIQRLCDHMDDLIGRATKAPCRSKRRMLRAVERMRWRIKDLVDELHHKAAVFLCRNFDIIAIPKFETSQMVTKLRSKTARAMLTWAHYRFQLFLTAKAAEYGVTVLNPSEAYTSKTCSYCGTIKQIGSAKTWKCVCGRVHDRDDNGARGIFLRTLGDSPWSAQADLHSLLVGNNR